MFEFPRAVERTLSTTSDASESYGGEAITSGHYAGNLGWHEGLLRGAHKPCVTEVLNLYAAFKETSHLLKLVKTYIYKIK